MKETATLPEQSTSTNVEEATNKNFSKNETMIERFRIEDSPFTIISTENEHFGVMGEYRMTEGYNSRGECEDELKCITWNRIIQVFMVLEKIRENDKEFNKQINESLTK